MVCHTLTNAGNVRTNGVQERHHMPPFGDRALEARIERIAREQDEELWLTDVLAVVPVFSDDRLKAGNAPNRLSGAGPGAGMSALAPATVARRLTQYGRRHCSATVASLQALVTVWRTTGRPCLSH